MKKMSLDINALQVESFIPAAGERRARGTVQGHMAIGGGNWDSWYCGDDRTDGPSHAPSCGATCDITGYNFCFENPCRVDF